MIKKQGLKIVTIVGARPQFIKAAVVSRAIAEHNSSYPVSQQIKEILVHTGQHYDGNMSQVFFREMHIPEPDVNLGIGSCSHGAMTGRMLEKLEEVLQTEKPALVLVYGDTNSTLAGALAAAKLHIPVAHVEAGLRSFNRRMPEEINRLLTDHLAQWLFCPTRAALLNLRQEGIVPGSWSARDQGGVAVDGLDGFPRVSLPGDVTYDAALYYQRLAKPSSKLTRTMAAVDGPFYLATLHRAENTDDSHRLVSIIAALDSIAATTPLVLPLHPRTSRLVAALGLQIRNITLLEPLGYFDMLYLLTGCKGIFTDSGGVQKEAYYFGKPCVTLRDETEWEELVQLGCNVLTGADSQAILAAEQTMESRPCNFGAPLFGSGDAGKKIVETLWQELS
ncbi:MAG TPA: UDP-N-acetylglucosamine 2-epimerase (non-hydrolyzing) [Bacillota bacterium]|nr:UDP-N-acetylglucosamine 2-epimerase (non-hydrolyzing) [Bacillota bacterium]